MSLFRDTLRGIAERVEGTRAVAIVGLDGISVETYGVAQALSIEMVAAELMAFLKSAQDPRAEMFSGQIREMTIGGEDSRIVLSRISRRYYLLLLLGGEGILGQGRYELARAAAALEKELV
jgi:predicted regulator of Ras-like GTPase activity (Roadblock/LC7/MglB family)